MKTIPIKRALISVSDKTNIIEFATDLAKLNIEIVSTGGTSQLLSQAGITHRSIEAVTGLPEMFDGRVKTLHPKVHAGILGRRDRHHDEAIKHQIDWIDLVVVNFYPFDSIAADKTLAWEKAIELIDIGGPTMVRAAAKNFAWVSVVVDPADYRGLLEELRIHQGVRFSARESLAQKAFGVTARYDSMIHDYFAQKTSTHSDCPSQLDLHLEKVTDLRYGENPHQKACAYRLSNQTSRILSAHLHQGKALSYNNMLDAEAALTCVREFSAPACIIIKHANPCGAAVATDIDEAYKRAYHADSTSAFGGIVAINRTCTERIAEWVTEIFMEVIIAPEFTEAALSILRTKPNLRVLKVQTDDDQAWEMKFITGGVLLQEKDEQVIEESQLQLVTQAKPSATDIENMLFAWQVLKHVKSNGIVLAKHQTTVSIGAGQVSRIDAVDIAIRKAGSSIEGCILASDAFFPFRDSIDRIAQTGIRAIIQPGGSVRDPEVIAACDEHGIAMVFTGKRCFRH